MPSSAPFETLTVIGHGAESRVYRARLKRNVGELERGVEVAVKRLKNPQDPAARRAFEREAEVALKLQHPAVVRIHGTGEDEDGPYLILDLLPGPSLAELIATEGALNEVQVRRIGARLADALAALHDQGYVHNDLKPENVLLNSRGRAILIDFGLAESQHAATKTEAGSLAYFAPERLNGLVSSPASDVFALGVLLYEGITGQHPFVPPGAESAVAIAAIQRARCDLPSRRIPRVSPLFDELIVELLALRTSGRPRASQVAQRLRAGEGSAWWRRRARETSHVRWGVGERLPLLGRDHELDQLLSLWHCVGGSDNTAPRSTVALLTGSSGSGKARLAGEFCVRARRLGQSPRYLFARWSPSQGSRSAGALYAWFERWAERRPSGAMHPELSDDLERMLVPALARNLLDPTHADGSATAHLVEWLVHLGRQAPTILFLDDMHLAGMQTLDALFQLFARLSSTRLLILVSARLDTIPAEPELFRRFVALFEPDADEREIAADRARLDLGPIHDDAIRAWVNALFHTSAPRLRLGEVLIDRSLGNPGMFSELISWMTRRGLAVPRSKSDPRLVLTRSPDEIPHPPSLERLLVERLDTLEQDERQWLERASVIGGRITLEFLARTYGPVDAGELNAALARLVETDWLVPAGSRYRFRRPALREAIYRSLPPGRRRLLHLAASSGLVDEGDSLALSYQRAFHLHAAGNWGELVALCRRLLPLLRGRSSSRRLLALARYGLDGLRQQADVVDLERGRIEFLEIAADAAGRLGLREDQRELLDDLADIHSQGENPELAARVYLLHGRYNVDIGQPELARNFLTQATRFAGLAQHDDLEAAAWTLLGEVHTEFGDLDQARSSLTLALEHARRPYDQARAWIARATVAVLDDAPETGLSAVERALELVAETKRPSGDLAARAWMLAARVRRNSGRIFEALAAAKRATRFARKAGERRIEVEARARFGALLLDMDHPEAAEAQLREALLIAEEIGDAAGRALALVWLGVLLWDKMDMEAADSIERGRQIAADLGYSRAEAVALAIQARIAVLGPEVDLERALETSERALKLIDEHKAEITDELTIAGTRALVLKAAGRGREHSALVARQRRRIQRSVKSVTEPALAKSRMEHLRGLLASVQSTEGSVWPRRS